jgi:3-isopropylmalate dehydrogenase
MGKDVIEAMMIALNTVWLGAQYIYGDIGWEFWCKERNVYPNRMIKIPKETEVCLFEAITSNPREDVAVDLSSTLQGKGLSYYSPIVKLCQESGLFL